MRDGLCLRGVDSTPILRCVALTAVLVHFFGEEYMKNQEVVENLPDLLQFVYRAKRGDGDAAIPELRLPSKDLEGLKFPATLTCWHFFSF